MLSNIRLFPVRHLEMSCISSNFHECTRPEALCRASMSGDEMRGMASNVMALEMFLATIGNALFAEHLATHAAFGL